MLTLLRQSCVSIYLKRLITSPEDYITDRSQRFMASEIIREKLMRFLGAELPYSVTVEIERFVSNERGGYDINGLILVEREGQKKMVIGNKGPRSNHRD